jgi:hypothetical protein
MGACMSNSVPKVEEPVQKPVEPAKKLDWGAVGFKTAAISVEVVVGLIRGAFGVTLYTVIFGVTTVATVYWYAVPFVLMTIMNTLMGGAFSDISWRAGDFWQNFVVETVVDFYELCINRTIGDCLRNIRDIWRMSVYR